jgi:hypothetical protein
MGRKKLQLISEAKSKAWIDPTNPVAGSGNLDLYHFENFVQSVRGNAQLNSPVNEGYKSVLLCLLANVAQRTGNTLHCDASNGHILNDKAASALWQREYEKGWEPIV